MFNPCFLRHMYIKRSTDLTPIAAMPGRGHLPRRDFKVFALSVGSSKC